MRILTILLVATSCFFLNACKKMNKCGQIEQIELYSNGPVVSGWPLHLSTENSQSYTYRWHGPNGWSVEYDYLTNMSGSETRDSIGPNDAGTYIVELLSGDCVVKRGIVNVEVIDAPAPPCTVAVNSSTTTLGGVGGVTYNYVSGHVSGSNYIATGNTGNQTINFVFKNGKKPKPGVYHSVQAYYPSENSEVAVYIQTGFYDFIMKKDYDIYVNEVNGALEYTFCSSQFSNPVSSSSIVISCRLRVL